MVELYGKDAIDFERKAQLEMEKYRNRVKIIERKIVEVETEYDYPIYLYFQDENCHDELVMVTEGYQLNVKHDYYGFSVVKGLGFPIEQHILENNLTTKEHFLEVYNEAINSLSKLF